MKSHLKPPPPRRRRRRKRRGSPTQEEEEEEEGFIDKTERFVLCHDPTTVQGETTRPIRPLCAGCIHFLALKAPNLRSIDPTMRAPEISTAQRIAGIDVLAAIAASSALRVSIRAAVKRNQRTPLVPPRRAPTAICALVCSPEVTRHTALDVANPKSASIDAACCQGAHAGAHAAMAAHR